MNHLHQYRFVRPLMALAIVCILSFMTMAATSSVSAHALTTSKVSATACGTFVPASSKEHANMVVEGVTIGYVETVTDGCGNYKEHARISKTPPVAGPFSLLLMSGDNFGGTPGFSAAVPQDAYLSLQYGGSPSHAFFEIQFLNTGALYYAVY